MSTKNGNAIRMSKFHLLLVGLLAMSASANATADEQSANVELKSDERSSISLHIVRGGRENRTDTRETTEDYEPLVIAGSRAMEKTRSDFSNSDFEETAGQNANFDFWFYEADVILYNDDDNDGFYHGIDLLFDVDTNFVAADVYAVLYLSFEGGPWNEYAETVDFTIYGASGDDAYVIETELMSGYLTGSYDLLIEVFDAYDNSFLASFGPEDTSELAYLPLEDFNRDAPVEVIVVHDHGGGGSMDQLFVGMLFLLLLVSALEKIWRRRNDALVRIDSR